ncbi:MAG: PspC domain-containing protein [candidate division Zixibacteria bacterium]|nr:PspC domain-containing protein [candidate division Zixibacteria bacterium]
MGKKLYRSTKNSMIAGVCGGLGEYFNVDPTIVRLLTILLIFADGVGVILYIIAWIIVPRTEAVEAEMAGEKAPDSKKYLPGLILIAVGFLFLFHNFIPWFHFRLIWPIALIIVGIFLLLKS